MTRRARWLIFGGTASVILLAQAIFLASITSPYPAVHEPPEEANRVVHPEGFSIVKPGRTRAIIGQIPPHENSQITILPNGGSSRYTPMLSVQHLRNPPDHARLERDGFRPGTFQRQTAFIYMGPSGKYDAAR